MGSATFEVPLWRALAVFRIAALSYAGLRVALNFDEYRHPALGWLVIGVMGGWTAITTVGYARGRLRRWPLLVADLTVAAACVLASPAIIGDAAQRLGLANNIPVAWMASPVVAWGIAGGRRRGAVAALVLTVAVLSTFTTINEATVDAPVLLLLVGVVVGHVARLNIDAQERLQHAAEVEAAGRERQRLARGIHDSVLQVLALVQRRGAALGGDAAELGRLAGEQEAALRALVGAESGVPEGSDLDLRTVLAEYATADVSMAMPAHPVPLPTKKAREFGLAVGAALDNVRRHCGDRARAWVLLEVEEGTVVVTIRDDGPGIAPGRLDEAAAAGRLGVAGSIEGRVRDLGGGVAITSVAHQGTEVELRVPLP